MKLINSESIAQYDTENMLALIQDFPKQCRQAQEIGNGFALPHDLLSSYQDVTNVVVAGMGGSAIGADVAFAVLREQMRVPLLANRSYTLPAFVDEKTLFIAASYSGNTEETLSCFRQAEERGARIVVISTGGELAELAAANSLPFVRIPSGQPPRSALGYMCIPMLFVLGKLGLAPGFDLNAQFEEALPLLEAMCDEHQPESGNTPSMALARKLYGALPLVYASNELQAIAVRWRGQFNENSKVLAYSAAFPEMNHNEIEGWEYTTGISQQCYLVMLRDAEDHPRTQARMAIAEQLVQCHARDVVHVHSQGEGRLARLLSLIYCADWVTFYLAILNETNPTAIPQIDEFKVRLSQVP